MLRLLKVQQFALIHMPMVKLNDVSNCFHIPTPYLTDLALSKFPLKAFRRSLFLLRINCGFIAAIVAFALSTYDFLPGLSEIKQRKIIKTFNQKTWLQLLAQRLGKIISFTKHLSTTLSRAVSTTLVTYAIIYGREHFVSSRWTPPPKGNWGWFSPVTVYCIAIFCFS